jgi:formylglycine-generating enzyme required for sulfatase activity
MVVTGYLTMMTLKQFLLKTHENLLILQEREAKYGGNAPVDLLNEIKDHDQAIKLIEQALSTELTETGLQELKSALRPLLLNPRFVEQLDLDQVKLETPHLPFEPETVLIPAGPFLMGSLPADIIPVEETPQHEVVLPAYRIGQYPVTNAQYAEFIKREKQQEPPKKTGWFLREPPADKLDHPVTGVSWNDAQAYCRWLSDQTGRLYRLPTEAEWEKAASWAGGQKRWFPWGDEWQAGRCNFGSDDTTPVMAFPEGVSPSGCYDMLGNAQEWTSTLWGSDPKENAFPYPYRANDGREEVNPTHLHRVYRVYRSGSFRDEPARLRCSVRGNSDPESKIRWRGFRVVSEI